MVKYLLYLISTEMAHKLDPSHAEVVSTSTAFTDF